MMSDALSVACPLCGAAPGHGCVSTGSGRPFTGFVHRERKQAARNALRAGILENIRDTPEARETRELFHHWDERDEVSDGV